MSNIIEFKIDMDSNTSFIVEDKHGFKADIPVSTEDLISSIVSSTKNKRGKKNAFKPISSPLAISKDGMQLVQTIQDGKNSFLYIIKRSARPAAIQIFNRFYDNVGVPNLLFAIRVINNHFSQLYVVATCSELIEENMRICKYPFSNVLHNNGSVCLGSNSLSDMTFTNLNNLFNVINYFFSMPNNMDGYSCANNSEGYEFEQLVKFLQNKEFENSLLVSNQSLTTYKDWINSIINNK